MTTRPVTGPSVAPADAALADRRFSDVIVPLGNRASAELALAPAVDVARRLGTRLHLLSVGIEEAEAEEMARRLAILADGFGATAETRVDYDVAAVILAVVREHDPALVCMASHGRGRLGEAVLGSCTTDVLAATPGPVLLAGPGLDPARRLADGPVVACVDGSEASETAVAAAADWATMLGIALEVLTVAGAGPDDHPDGYVDGLVAAWRRPGLEVVGRTIRDAAPAEAILDRVDAAPAGLLVVTTHARTGLPRMAFGSVASAVVRSSAVPVLVAPRPDADDVGRPPAPRRRPGRRDFGPWPRVRRPFILGKEAAGRSQP